MAVLCPDLLFGSRVEGMLRAAGHEIVRPGDPADAAVVDLTDEPERRIANAPTGIPRLAFYSHVEHDVRLRAQEAGFEMVVPRSRMAREGAALVERLLS